MKSKGGSNPDSKAGAIYRWLLRCYPRTFRNEFEDELSEAFEQAHAAAQQGGSLKRTQFWLRELRDLVWRAAQERWIEFWQSKRVDTMIETTISTTTPEDMRGREAVWPGVLFFAVLGLFLMLLETPDDSALSNWLASHMAEGAQSIMWVWLLFPYAGLCAGWIRSFPSWSYPYVGYSTLFSLYMMSVATPGLRFFGYTFGPSDPWGWRSWIPFLLAVGIGLLVTRSFQPVKRFFTNIGRDWSILSYAMFGFMPLLIMVNFDEMDNHFSLYFMIVLALCMVLTAWLYLRERRLGQRASIIVIGVLAAIVITTIGPIAYWLPRNGVNVAGSVMMSAIVAVFILWPALLALGKWALGRRRPA